MGYRDDNESYAREEREWERPATSSSDTVDIPKNPRQYVAHITSQCLFILLSYRYRASSWFYDGDPSGLAKSGAMDELSAITLLRYRGENCQSSVFVAGDSYKNEKIDAVLFCCLLALGVLNLNEFNHLLEQLENYNNSSFKWISRVQALIEYIRKHYHLKQRYGYQSEYSDLFHWERYGFDKVFVKTVLFDIHKRLAHRRSLTFPKPIPHYNYPNSLREIVSEFLPDAPIKARGNQHYLLSDYKRYSKPRSFSQVGLTRDFTSAFRCQHIIFSMCDYLLNSYNYTFPPCKIEKNSIAQDKKCEKISPYLKDYFPENMYQNDSEYRIKVFSGKNFYKNDKLDAVLYCFLFVLNILNLEELNALLEQVENYNHTGGAGISRVAALVQYIRSYGDSCLSPNSIPCQILYYDGLFAKSVLSDINYRLLLQRDLVSPFSIRDRKHPEISIGANHCDITPAIRNVADPAFQDCPRPKHLNQIDLTRAPNSVTCYQHTILSMCQYFLRIYKYEFPLSQELMSAKDSCSQYLKVYFPENASISNREKGFTCVFKGEQAYRNNTLDAMLYCFLHGLCLCNYDQLKQLLAYVPILVSKDKHFNQLLSYIDSYGQSFDFFDINYVNFDKNFAKCIINDIERRVTLQRKHQRERNYHGSKLIPEREHSTIFQHS